MSSHCAAQLAGCPVAPARAAKSRRRSRVPRAAGDSASSSSGVSPGEPSAGKYSTRLEHMDTLQLHPYRDLDLAENELGTYCSNLTPDEQPEKCWQAYSFLERKREEASGSCDADRPETCEELEQLNEMTHQLLATGSMDDLVATFSTLARVEELRSAKSAAGAAAAAEPSPGEQADPVRALFARLDADGDGRLSIAEFRQGMALLGDELDGSAVALAMDAMDVHGRIGEQQFRDIVEAEQLNSQSMVAKLWRYHLPRTS
ncbi:Calcium-dependent kinase 7 [Micractinium conductrix]|uniref:Calcium-dependent kinase 7 n=1 Tax=Micractinium conductrix TaxID=554055 RepID=A0A2P6VIV9_9CHLO|nr:Calcium-dependent kinase 7 [Micractinium conductrix]|eukprot:PSC74012.1 Calcium-dependent kinase 7 [Micractinium conductrix]